MTDQPTLFDAPNSTEAPETPAPAPVAPPAPRYEYVGPLTRWHSIVRVVGDQSGDLHTCHNRNPLVAGIIPENS